MTSVANKRGLNAAGKVINDATLPVADSISAGSFGAGFGTADSAASPSLVDAAASNITGGAGSNLLNTAGNFARWIGPGLVAADYAKTGLSKAMTRDLSDWRNGASTGASLGSALGPVGTVAGAVMGAGMGLAGKMTGIGKTKYSGYNPVSGTYNQGGDMTMLGYKDEGKKRYNSYNDAMNYLNNYNQVQDADWDLVGDSEYGRMRYDTKMANPTGAGIGFALAGPFGGAVGGLFGKKNKTTYIDAYKGNLNTGYNVLDDFTNGTDYAGTWNLDTGWNPYQQQQDEIYQNRIGYLTGQEKNNFVNSIKNNVSNVAQSVDQKQYDQAKNKLDQQLARGYMDQRQYSKALAALNDNRIANRQALAEIGNNQLNQWKTDIAQAYDNALDSDLTDGWIKNYNAWKGDDMSGLYDKATDAANAYLMNNVSDDYLSSLMSQSNTYNPDLYMATGVASTGDDSLGQWDVGRRKRKANLVYGGE